MQVIRAVGYAHGRLVVHRDLKPSNVMITPDERAHLLDFGIAKLLAESASEGTALTREQGRVFTPQYASPEQIAGEPVTVSSDVYSLGVMLYELLTDTLPFDTQGSTTRQLEDAVLRGGAPLASSRVKDRARAKALKGDLDAILTKALRREPERRYPTADAMAQDIERYLGGQPVAAQPDSRAYRLRKALRRNWVGVAATATVLVTILSGSAVAVVEARHAARAAARERVVKEFVADVFRANSRSNSHQRPRSSQSLIEGGAQLIQTRFAGQPELQAELYGVVGGVFSDMGAYELAANYATRQVESLSALRADQHEQAQALIALTKALTGENRFDDAELQARRASELATGNPPLEVEAMLMIARSQFANGKLAQARQMLESADAKLGAQVKGNPSLRAKALFQRADLLTAANRRDEAYPLYERAIEMAVSSEGRLSTTAVSARLAYAYHLFASTHADKAVPIMNAGLSALHELGGAHEARALMIAAGMARRRYTSWDTGTLAEAQAEILKSRVALMEMNLFIPEWFIPQIDFWHGSILAAYGDIAAALPLLEATESMLIKHAAGPYFRFEIAALTGDVYMMAGRHDLASDRLREALEQRRLAGRGKQPYAVFDYTNLARNLRMQGQFDTALKVLDQAPVFEAIRGEGTRNPNRYARFLEWERAAVLLDRGDFAQALRRLQATAPSADEYDEDIRIFQSQVGEALCANGQASGLDLILRVQAHDAARRLKHPNSPDGARMLAVAGSCALKAGRRDEALQLSSQARATFTAQPGVSPYFKQPLYKLERALGLNRPVI
jgi:serine/threonine-protein kinase